MGGNEDPSIDVKDFHFGTDEAAHFMVKMDLDDRILSLNNIRV